MHTSDLITSEYALVHSVCDQLGNAPTRMMDILQSIQDGCGFVSPEAMEIIARKTGTHRVEIQGVVSFYAFFSEQPQGRFVIRLCDDIVDQFSGLREVQASFEQALGVRAGQTTEDGLFSFHLTPCIGMCDQAPAAMVNNQIFTQLTPSKVRNLIRQLKKVNSVEDLEWPVGDGKNAHPLMRSMVKNNICKRGDLLLSAEVADNAGMASLLNYSPREVIQEVEMSGLRGRGGAGFPTGRKWRMAAETSAEQRYVICNADEGEPGTFKDRVLLTERPHLLFEGMTLAAYAIGSTEGILYLRGEYRYLLPYLESVLQDRRELGLLGQIKHPKEFVFDVRIQLGAGAYICGEESALISSCEGKRGEPKNRPPFPVVSGYLDKPTIVNNVETFCNVPLILARGAIWFSSFGTQQSSGTKLLSISGDCKRPGIYEYPMGVSVRDVLNDCGAISPAAIQVGGASGSMIGRVDFHRTLCFEDLPTAGAFTVFSDQRNLLQIVDYYLRFFVEESCGYCTPCRVGNVFLKKGLEKIRKGQAEKADIEQLKELSQTIIATSRCGLGHTSPNPFLSSLEKFPMVYAALLKESTDGFQASFDIQDALEESRRLAKRRSLIYDTRYGDKG